MEIELYVFNGLLLAAHWDAAFDADLVTVEADGTLRSSPGLPASVLRVLGGITNFSAVVIKLHPQHAPYLKWHHENVFKSIFGH